MKSPGRDLFILIRYHIIQTIPGVVQFFSKIELLGDHCKIQGRLLVDGIAVAADLRVCSLLEQRFHLLPVAFIRCFDKFGALQTISFQIFTDNVDVIFHFHLFQFLFECFFHSHFSFVLIMFDMVLLLGCSVRISHPGGRARRPLTEILDFHERRCSNCQRAFYKKHRQNNKIPVKSKKKIRIIR